MFDESSAGEAASMAVSLDLKRISSGDSDTITTAGSSAASPVPMDVDDPNRASSLSLNMHAPDITAPDAVVTEQSHTPRASATSSSASTPAATSSAVFSGPTTEPAASSGRSVAADAAITSAMQQTSGLIDGPALSAESAQMPTEAMSSPVQQDPSAPAASLSAVSSVASTSEETLRAVDVMPSSSKHTVQVAPSPDPAGEIHLFSMSLCATV